MKGPRRELLAVPILVGVGALMVAMPGIANAGTLRDGSRVDITLGETDQAVGRIVADGVQPGDPLQTSVISVKQTQVGKAAVRLSLTNLVSKDGDCSHGELVYDPTCGPNDKGELADMLRVRVQPAVLDEQGNCVYRADAPALAGLDGVSLTAAVDKAYVVADLARDQAACVAFSWWFPMGGREDSASMSDIATFDIDVSAQEITGGGSTGGGGTGNGDVPQNPPPTPPVGGDVAGGAGTGAGTGTVVAGEHFEQGGKTPDVRVFPAQPGLAATGANETWLVLAVGGLLISFGLVLKAVVGRRRTP